MNVKRQIKELNFSIKQKDVEIDYLKKNVKYTKIQEIQVIT